MCMTDYMSEYTSFVRNRIVELRMQKDVSEYEMSMQLGHNKNYVQLICNGKSLPSMAAFFDICDYFNITPMQFFDEAEQYPELVRTAFEEMKDFDEDDLLFLITVFRRLKQDKGYEKEKC